MRLNGFRVSCDTTATPSEMVGVVRVGPRLVSGTAPDKAGLSLQNCLDAVAGTVDLRVAPVLFVVLGICDRGTPDRVRVGVVQRRRSTVASG